jgi:hypothetical protein
MFKILLRFVNFKESCRFFMLWKANHHKFLNKIEEAVYDPWRHDPDIYTFEDGEDYVG